jgi:hypothetical protein
MTFDKYLKEQLKNPEFKEYYEEEKELLEIAFRLNEERKRKGLSQSKVAKDARLTQQRSTKFKSKKGKCLTSIFIQTVKH